MDFLGCNNSFDDPLLISSPNFIADSLCLGALAPVTAAVFRSIMFCFNISNRHTRGISCYHYNVE